MFCVQAAGSIFKLCFKVTPHDWPLFPCLGKLQTSRSSSRSEFSVPGIFTVRLTIKHYLTQLCGVSIWRAIINVAQMKTGVSQSLKHVNLTKHTVAAKSIRTLAVSPSDSSVRENLFCRAITRSKNGFKKSYKKSVSRSNARVCSCFFFKFLIQQFSTSYEHKY